MRPGGGGYSEHTVAKRSCRSARFVKCISIFANCKACITLLLKVWGLPQWTGGCYIIGMTGGKGMTALE